jgi:hypothetical protein
MKYVKMNPFRKWFIRIVLGWWLFPCICIISLPIAVLTGDFDVIEEQFYFLLGGEERWYDV